MTRLKREREKHTKQINEMKERQLTYTQIRELDYGCSGSVKYVYKKEHSLAVNEIDTGTQQRMKIVQYGTIGLKIRERKKEKTNTKHTQTVQSMQEPHSKTSDFMLHWVHSRYFDASIQLTNLENSASQSNCARTLSTTEQKETQTEESKKQSQSN